ncbi:MAG: nuclear transport factor 2 family protein [Pseudomonadota bacterium]
MSGKTGVKVMGGFLSAFERRDLGAAMDMLTEDVVYIVIGDPGGETPIDRETCEAIPWIGRYDGRKAVRRFVSILQANIDIISIAVSKVIENGEDIAVFGTFSYIAKSTGKRFDSDYAIRARIRGHGIAEYTFYENTYAVAAAFRTEGSWTVEHDVGASSVPSGDTL